MTTTYCTNAELRAQLNIQDPDSRLDAIIEATSRAIDQWCGQFFYDSGSATARVFKATDEDELSVHPFSTTTGLVVKTDTGNSGTFDNTWTVTTDYVAAPESGYDSAGLAVPYDTILAVGSRCFPTWDDRARVQVTARWGWSTVPAAVKEACIIKAARLYRRRDVMEDTGGGFGAMGLFRIGQREDPDVVALLGPFRNVDDWVIR